ncbi:hypothetical protein AHF37_11246 [Paragonimus kellicotti]|nr:hypothetical protein AHF37_11246 [Paragonimus kellicotti]
MSNSLQAPDLFWTDPTVSPSVEKWTSWKSTFIDYVEMLPVFNCEIKLTEDHKLKLLRLRLGDEGRRLFDALNLQSKLEFSDVLADLDKHCGIRMNTYTSRFKFSSLRQAAGEDLNGFISRLLCSVRQCEYGTVPQKKIEEVF